MRVKRGITAKARHKKIFRANKGYRMTKRRLIKVATEAYLHAGEYAYAGRKNKKRDMRRNWITRISQESRQQGLAYGALISKLKAANIEIDRKMLAYLITDHPDAFKAIIEHAKSVN